MDGRLSHLKCGECAAVSRIDCDILTRRRLTDLGMICGTPVICLMQSLGGGICAYRICDSVIALRREDADCISIKSI